VLADVTIRKDEMMERLEENVQELMTQRNALQESLTKALEEIERKDEGFVRVEKEVLEVIKVKAERMVQLEDRLKDEGVTKELTDDELLSTSLKLVRDAKDGKTVKELIELRTQLQSSLDREEELKSTLAFNKSLISDLELQLQNQTTQQSRGLSLDTTIITSNVTNDNEAIILKVQQEQMKIQLQQKETSLDNAKKIISSLETSNGSIVSELREKLKQKEEEMQQLQLQSSQDNVALGVLKAELGIIQKKKLDVEKANRQARESLKKQRALHQQMKRSVNELVAKSSTPEKSSSSSFALAGSSNVMEQMTSVMRNALCMMDTDGSVGTAGAMRSRGMTGDTLEYGKEEKLALSISQLLSSDGEAQVEEMKRQLENMKMTKHITESNLKLEREEKKITMKNMESAMKTIREQMEKQNEQMEKMKQECDGELINCQSEMQLLRDQLDAKDAMLANKEQELEVLRQTVDGRSAVGYVSDPDEDSEDGADVNGNKVAVPGVISLPSAAEVFAAQYGPSSSVVGGSIAGNSLTVVADPEESSALKERLLAAENEKINAMQELQKTAKELDLQKSSLANAKMIISSLEKANKAAMEDLRTRLQHSNDAIASLLDKSMEHEETTAELKEEIDTLRRTKEEADEEHKEEVKKYKEESIQNLCKIAAQEKEIMELKNSIKRYADALKDDDMSLVSTDTYASQSVA